MPSADAERSRRTIRLRTKKRTNQGAWGISANEKRVGRKTEVVDRVKREREETRSAVRRKKKIVENLWPEMDAQRKLDAGSRNVQ